MKWDDIISIKGKDYKFEHVPEEPLMLIMKIDDKYHLQRDIDCDGPHERILLILKYKSVINRVEKDATFSTQVYDGKEIDSAEFMKNLLEHVLHQII